MNNKSYNQNVSENEKRRIRARSKKFMIKEIDGLQYLYTKDAKAVVTEEKKKNAMSICDTVGRLPRQRQNFWKD